MGYYINVLQKGEKYTLNGETIEFIEKQGSRFYFYLCKYDMETFRHIRTNEKVGFLLSEINYIKRFQQSTNGLLKRIGKDKVFARN